MVNCVLKRRRDIGNAEFICGEIMTAEEPKALWDLSLLLSRAQCRTFLGSATGMDRAFLMRDQWSHFCQNATFSATQKRKKCYALSDSSKPVVMPSKVPHLFGCSACFIVVGINFLLSIADKKPICIGILF